MRALRILDDRKRELLFLAPPRRIVSLVPSDTLSLFALGAGDRVVGRTRYCTEPHQARNLPEVGGTKDVDVEAVLRLEPDLIVCNQEENSRKHVLALIRSRVPVLVGFPRTVAAGLAHLARLARIVLPGDEKVKELLREGYQALREAQADARPKLRAFVPIWMDPLMTINGETFISDALWLAGAENVFADRERRHPLAADLVPELMAAEPGERDTRYPRITLEEVLARAPGVILLPDEPHPFSEADAAIFRAQQTPAALSGRVLLCGGRDLSWYGSQSVAGIPRLRALVESLRQDCR